MKFIEETIQDFSPYSGLLWWPTGWRFECSFKGFYTIPAEQYESYLAKQSVIFLNLIDLLFNHKCSCYTSSVMCMCVFMHYAIMLKKVTCGSFFICVLWFKKLGRKTPSHFLLQLQNRPKLLFYLFCKGHFIFFARSLCKHWVGTSTNVIYAWLCNVLS